MKYLVLCCSMAIMASGCVASALNAEKTEPAQAQPPELPAPDMKQLPRLSKDDFNRIAA